MDKKQKTISLDSHLDNIYKKVEASSLGWTQVVPAKTLASTLLDSAYKSLRKQGKVR